MLSRHDIDKWISIIEVIYDLEELNSEKRLLVEKDCDNSWGMPECPFCYRNHGPHLNIVTIDPEDNSFRCTRCGKEGFVVELVKSVKNCTEEQAIEWVNTQIFGSSTDV